MNKLLCSLACTWMTIIESQFYIIDSWFGIKCWIGSCLVVNVMKALSSPINKFKRTLFTIHLIWSCVLHRDHEIIGKEWTIYSKICVKRPLKNRQNKVDSDKRLLNEGPKYCRMLPLGHSAILFTCIKQKLVLKTKFRCFCEWPFYTGFTVNISSMVSVNLPL